MFEEIEKKYKFIEFDWKHENIEEIAKLIKYYCDDLCSRNLYIDGIKRTSGVSEFYIRDKIKELREPIEYNRYKGLILMDKEEGIISKIGKPVAFIIYHQSISCNFNSYSIDIFCRSINSIKGSGLYLFKKVLNKAKENKVQVIFLEAIYGSIEYYKSLGFEEFNKNYVSDTPECFDGTSLGLFVDEAQLGGNKINQNNIYPVHFVNKKLNPKINDKIIEYFKTKFDIDHNDNFDAMDYYKDCDYILYVVDKTDCNIIGCISIRKELTITGRYKFVCSNFFYENDIVANILFEKLRDLKFKMKITKIHMSLFRNDKSCKFIESKQYYELPIGTDYYAYYEGR